MTNWEKMMEAKERAARYASAITKDSDRFGKEAVNAAMNFHDNIVRAGGNVPSPYSSFLLGVEWQRKHTSIHLLETK